MTANDGSGRVEAIDLTVHGRTVRVTVDDDRSRDALAEDFDGRVTEEPGVTAFAVRAASGSSRLHVVMDRSGFVLGRTRSGDEALGILRRHLEAFAPPPPGATRFTLRALLGDDGTALLAGFPLFTEPAPVERRLSREAFRLVDRLSVDVGLDDSATPRLLPSTAPATDATPCVGHAASPNRTAPIAAILLPGGPQPATAAQVVTILAEVSRGDGSHQARLESAEALGRLPIRMVATDRRSARYEALAGSS